MKWLRWPALTAAAVTVFACVTTPAIAEPVPAISQWNLGADSYGINARSAWSTSQGAGSVVGVIDTGISPHLDLTGSSTSLVGGNALPGYDFIANTDFSGDGDGWDADPTDATINQTVNGPVPSWHGLHVAGTVAAADDGVGTTGVAPLAQVVPIRLVGTSGWVDTAQMATAIRWGAGLSVTGASTNTYPASVLNLSIAVKGSCPSDVQDAIDAAVGRGVAVVVAAGNTWDAPTTGKRDVIAANYPANCQHVIAVTASDYLGQPTGYTNVGSEAAAATIAAPGDIWSTCNSGDPYCANGYAAAGGTSMSSPEVAGVIALLQAVRPGLSVAQLTDAITATATPFAATARVDTCVSAEVCGAGIINAGAALAYVEEHYPATTGEPESSPSPSASDPAPITTPEPTPSPSESLVGLPQPTPAPAPVTPTASATPVPAPSPLANTRRPTASGTFRVGHKVRATTGTWNPTPTSYRYQWYRSGKKISKATKSSYKLTRSDRHKKISVKVTVSRPGYLTTSATSTNHKVK